MRAIILLAATAVAVPLLDLSQHDAAVENVAESIKSTGRSDQDRQLIHGSFRSHHGSVNEARETNHGSQTTSIGKVEPARTLKFARSLSSINSWSDQKTASYNTAPTISTKPQKHKKATHRLCVPKMYNRPYDEKLNLAPKRKETSIFYKDKDECLRGELQFFRQDRKTLALVEPLVCYDKSWTMISCLSKEEEESYKATLRPKTVETHVPLEGAH